MPQCGGGALGRARFGSLALPSSVDLASVRECVVNLAQAELDAAMGGSGEARG